MNKLTSLALCLTSIFSFAQENIRLNQLGFLPESQKIAICVDTDLSTFSIVKASNGQEVYAGDLSNTVYWNNSKEDVKIADFSSYKNRGRYQLKIGSETSYTFSIQDDVLEDLTKATIKAYYFNRASTELTEQFAGNYNRPLGHPDDQVIVLPSAASESRPAGTVISTPKGWYDAGDYNKYIVNSGISVFTLLSAYENYSGYYDSLEISIPENTNEMPDLLDEVLWNLEWMASMQDPEDGGVYNKTTHSNFQGIVMPHQATAKRYVVAKGTAATLDFAACMAMASRIYKPWIADFAATCLEQAELAWKWAKANPSVAYNNPSAQDGYPGVSTGGYGDGNFQDEFFWAAAELYITTKNDEYYSALDFSRSFGVPGWPNVETLGLLSLITHRKQLTSAADTSSIKQKLFNLTDGIVTYQKSASPYKITNNNFYWGSNSIPGNHGMLLMQSYQLTKNIDYYQAALAALDYLLGRNATGYSFVTGLGSKPPMDIHHRQSAADNVAAPVPGFLAGGPNPQNTNDDCGSSKYPSLDPAKCYVDDWCSYSTNEVTINWNAPLVYLSGAIEATYYEQFYVPDTTTSKDILHSPTITVVKIYPNPTSFTINLSSSTNIHKSEILSLDGKIQLTSQQSNIDVSNLENGMYIIRIYTDVDIINKQFLVLKD